MQAGQVEAQTLTTLHNFTSTRTNSLGAYTNSDGASPQAALILLGNTFYGAAFGGGSSGNGTVFKMNIDGTGFTTLHSFTSGNTNSLGTYTNSDGKGPVAGLTLSGNTLYGTTKGGGSYGAGTAFKVNTDGTGFSTLHSFAASTFNNSIPAYTSSEGAQPSGSLILITNTLYGTAESGGSSGEGTVFSVNTNGSAFTVIHDFPYTPVLNPNNPWLDGAAPVAGLTFLDDTLYGTTIDGGSGGNPWPFAKGTVFAIGTNGFRVLHTFLEWNTQFGGGTSSYDGLYPYGGLILQGTTLYGTASQGGNNGGFPDSGTLYALRIDGTGFRTLHSFSATSPPSPNSGTNSDGANPLCTLVLVGNTLYGTASQGGKSANGTVFSLNTDGTGFKTLHNFAVGDGAGPNAGLIVSGNALFGTTLGGGSYGSGTVFSFSLPPQLIIVAAGANVILTWPTNATRFTLQSTTNLIPQVWTTNFSGPVVVNGQYTVTNPISGTPQFFRLSQ